MSAKQPADGRFSRVGRPRSQKAERAIIDATLDILSERGITELTIESVAARAGVGRPTIYRRWPSKLALVMAAIMTLPELRVPETGTVHGDLRKLAADTLAILRSSALGRVLPHLLTEISDDAVLNEAIARYRTERSVPWMAAVRRGIARGDLPPGTHPETLHLLVGGAVMQQSWSGARTRDAAVLDEVVSIVVAGIKSHAQQSKRPARQARRQAKR
ncbi:MAG: TetR/AcrR family transcriptional regulator [Candidatus Binatia bacterium]